MTRFSCFVFASALAIGPLWSQQRPARPAATTKIATINGAPLTAGGLRDLLRNAPESVLQRLRESPKDLFQNYTLTRQLADEARKAGLDKKFPYQQRLDWQAAGVLMSAEIQAMADAIEIPETQIRAYYTAHVDKYRTMKATAIRVMNSAAGGASQAKARADEAVKQARAGVDFGELGKKYSSEPDLAEPKNANTITPSFDLPEAAKARLFSTLTGQVTDPIQMSDSYVVFKVLELKARPLADVRNEIRSELQEQSAEAEMQKIQKSVQVKILLPAFFPANAPDPNSGQPASADTIDPKAIVAEVNGRKIVAKDLADEMQGMAPNVRASAAKSPDAFLLQYETLRILGAKARAAGLDKKPPASDQISWAADNVLMQAQLDEKTKSISSALKEQQDYYAANQNKYRVAQTKLIYVPFSLSPPPGSKQRNETQALQRANEAKQKFAKGADFVALVKEYSEEADSKARNGDMGLRYADTGLPEQIRTAVFNAKAGEVAGPVRLQNGMYLFLVKENKVQPFEEVRNDIYNLLADEKFNKWFEEYRGRIQVTIDDEAAIRAELAYH